MENTLTAVIIDDEPMAVEVVARFAKDIPFIRLAASFTNVFKAKEYLSIYPPDLLFLDIQMPGMTGIELFQLLPKPPLVIFTTAYVSHAVKSYELEAVDYLLKPFSPARFSKACNRALELYTLKANPEGKQKRSLLQIKSGWDIHKVNLYEIRYIQSAGNYVYLVFAGSRIMTRMTLTEIAGKLPGDMFIRIHKSYIIAQSAVTALKGEQVFIGETALPIGASFLSGVKRMLNNNG